MKHLILKKVKRECNKSFYLGEFQYININNDKETYPYLEFEPYYNRMHGYKCVNRITEEESVKHSIPFMANTYKYVSIDNRDSIRYITFIED